MCVLHAMYAMDVMYVKDVIMQVLYIRNLCNVRQGNAMQCPTECHIMQSMYGSYDTGWCGVECSVASCYVMHVIYVKLCKASDVCNAM